MNDLPHPPAASPPEEPPPSLRNLTRASAVADGAAMPPEAPPPASPDTETVVGVAEDRAISATREAIAFRLIALLAGVIGAYLFISLIFSLSCWTSHNCTVQESYNMSAASFTTVFTALIGIVGSVVGFYFGSKTR